MITPLALNAPSPSRDSDPPIYKNSMLAGAGIHPAFTVASAIERTPFPGAHHFWKLLRMRPRMYSPAVMGSCVSERSTHFLSAWRNTASE